MRCGQERVQERGEVRPGELPARRLACEPSRGRLAVAAALVLLEAQHRHPRLLGMPREAVKAGLCLLGPQQATEARASHRDPAVPKGLAIVLGITQATQVRVLDAGFGQGPPRRVLLKPFLRLIGVSRTSATTLMRLSTSEATNDSMSRPSYPADHRPGVTGATRAVRDRSSRETARASATAPTVKKAGWIAPSLSRRLTVPTAMPASLASRSRVHPRSVRNARTRWASARAWSWSWGGAER